MMDIRVRFAPSPTGHLHIGGIRSAMFNWLFARHTGGKYLLRIEDTDVVRSSQEYLDSQLESLRWFGLESDEPIVYQLARAHEHIAAAKKLMEQGKAYPCFCPPRDADQVVHDLDLGIGSKYDGTCRDKAYTPEDLERPYAIRFKLPASLETVAFEDVILGTITVNADQMDDFIIIRRDGTPIYNFCVVVDDIFMRITHVIRGQDHVSNTPKQVLYYQALGARVPLFAHLPLILGPAGNKLSKRDASVSVEEYRAQGFMANALANYLVRLGWAHGDLEIFTKDEIIPLFMLDGIGKKGAIFDIKKLEWLNGVYIRKTEPQGLIEQINDMSFEKTLEMQRVWTTEQLYRLLQEYKQRAVTLCEIVRDITAFASDPEQLDLSLLAKWRTEKTSQLVKDFLDALQTVKILDHEQLLAVAKAVCEKNQDKLVNLAQPLRLALTGSVTSPGVFELIAILGRERAITRITTLLGQL